MTHGANDEIPALDQVQDPGFAGIVERPVSSTSWATNLGCQAESRVNMSTSAALLAKNHHTTPLHSQEQHLYHISGHGACLIEIDAWRLAYFTLIFCAGLGPLTSE